MLGLASSLSTVGGVSEVLPSEISGLQLWLKNNTDIAVGQWNDQSGYGRHAVQADSDEQGTISDGGLDMSGADPEDHYQFSTDTTAELSLSGGQAFTVAAVVKREGSHLGAPAGDDNALFGGGGSAAYGPTFMSEEQISLSTRQTGATTSTYNFGTDTWVIDTQFLITVTRDSSGNVKFFKNGVEQTVTSSTNPTNNSGNLVVRYLGARTNPALSTAYTFDGVIYEFIIYNAALSGGDLSNLNSYLTSKFGL